MLPAPLLFVLLSIALIFLPGYLIYSIWTAREPSKYDWIIRVLNSAGFIVILFLIGRWDWFSYYLRFVILVLFNAAAVASFRHVIKKPFFVGEGRQRWMKKPSALVELVLVIGALIYLISGSFYSGDAVNLEFPLQDGQYYIAHGGSNLALNNHSPNESQHYALDIAELNALGRRSTGIYPSDLDSYVIFDEVIHSPCDGTVSAAVDGLPDLTPPESDSENPAGNHVVVDCLGVKVVLAHMREESVLVSEGDTVTSGQPLGRVGNSGNTTEPHLHMHAVEGDAADVLEGEAVPIEFDGSFPVRNSMITR